MISKLKPYPGYQKSVHRWVGEVPEHWTALPHRALFAERNDRAHPDEQMLSVTIKQGIIPQRTLLEGSSKKDSSKVDKSAYKLVLPGDLTYNKMRAWQSAIGVSAFRGIVSPAYVVMKFRRPDAIPSYYHYLYRTTHFAKEAERWSYGITSDMWSLRPEHFKMIYTLSPPAEEQAAIVRFLRWADQYLEYAIQLKRNVIKMLDEQRRALIQRTINDRLMQSVPLNILRLPQRVERIDGWNSLPVKRLIQLGALEIQDGNHGELHPTVADYMDTGIPFLMANNVRPEGLDLQGAAKISEERARSLRIGFALPGDILVTHKATIGQVGLVPDDLETPFVMLTPQVTYYRSKSSTLVSRYLFFYAQSPLFQDQLRLLSLNQSTRPYVGVGEQKNLIICFPSRERQLEMVSAADSVLNPTTIAKQRTLREIRLLLEYRENLTAQLVTGKLDVRGAAKVLDSDMSLDPPLEDLVHPDSLRGNDGEFTS